ncbi:hypothetical protein Bphy_4722 [Paraburkholderia phymatum STM815]|uniref:Uncharacterized protein n=1 Tax=Paraburkholderia phymatum (strain DSM 17167 / CIP 108236 / LMG 21445 / STM815) TaxID=391038 RepID=B2JRG5_PARP8|nr:hypothetical protein Bphy_4722 [Paraburkholderia phymatum STM815]
MRGHGRIDFRDGKRRGDGISAHTPVRAPSYARVRPRRRAKRRRDRGCVSRADALRTHGVQTDSAKQDARRMKLRRAPSACWQDGG